MCECYTGYGGDTCSEVVTTMQTDTYSSWSPTSAAMTTIILESIAVSSIAGAASGVVGGALFLVILLVCLFLIFTRLHKKNQLHKGMSEH